MTATVLRRIFPVYFECPKCGCTESRKTGRSRGGGLEYRLCRGCPNRYVVEAIAVEIHDGGRTSRIVPQK
jgi:predicted RNA-binding Zn-ribbon protein involved in translation (DUF1610 family)